MRKLVKIVSFSLLSISLTGCSVIKKQLDNPPPRTTGCSTKPKIEVAVESVEVQLQNLASSIDSSLNTLAAAQKIENPPIINTGPLITPEGGMGGLVDIDWTGPVGPLVERIACMTDYRVKTLGNEPAIPIIITITAKGTILAEVLQNASFQAKKRAEILVFPQNRVIELRYSS